MADSPFSLEAWHAALAEHPYLEITRFTWPDGPGWDHLHRGPVLYGVCAGRQFHVTPAMYAPGLVKLVYGVMGSDATEQIVLHPTAVSYAAWATSARNAMATIAHAIRWTAERRNGSAA